MQKSRKYKQVNSDGKSISGYLRNRNKMRTRGKRRMERKDHRRVESMPEAS